MASSFISLYGAVNIDGKAIDFNNSPLTEDMPTQQLVYVKLSTCKAINGSNISAFMLVFNNLKGLTLSTVYLYTYPTFTTMANFVTKLTTLGSTDVFTLYLNLLSYDYKPVTTTGQSVLINDRFVVPNGVRYMAFSNSTFVTVAINTKLSKTKFEFNGAQQPSGVYQYF